MTFVKILSALIIFTIISAIVSIILNNTSPRITPIIKRSSIEDISVLQLPEREDQIFMQALVRGKLVIHDNCLKLSVLGSNKVYTLVLPSHFQLHIKNEALIVKYQDKVVGQEGRNIRLSGGGVSGINHLGIEHQQCNHPPFWIAGEEMRLLK